MLERLTRVFAGDDFKNGALTFPDIDGQGLALRLKVEQRATERGKREEPESGSLSLDSIELEIIDEVGTLRQRGLQHYAEMRRVYAERLDRAGFASQEIAQIAREALNEFLARMTQWRANMTGPRKDVADAYRHLRQFQKANGLDRPVYQRSGWPWLIVLCFGAVVLESMINAGLFARSHEMGQLGGFQMAVVISAINVVGGGLLGGFSRNVNHVRWLRKFLGLGCLTGLLAGAGGFNLGVGHLRDAMPMADGLQAASIAAWESFIADPLALQSMEAALLVVIGLLVAFATAIKAWFSFDPYPGYSAVRREVDSARAAYAGDLEAALHDLRQANEESAAQLRDRQRTLDLQISEAADALHGQSSLRASRNAFLDNCDAKVNLVLGLYRDANRAARTTPAPARFDACFNFEPPQEVAEAQVTRVDADDVRRRTAEAIDDAISAMADAFEGYVCDFQHIDRIEEGGVDAGGSVSARPTSPNLTPVPDDMAASVPPKVGAPRPHRGRAG